MAHQQQKVSPKFQCKIYFKHGSIFLLYMKKHTRQLLIFPFSAWTLLVGRQECIWPVKSWVSFVGGNNLTGACISYSSSCHHHLHHPQLQ